MDYSDVSSPQNQLEEDIHTVISALSFRNEDSVKAQLNLIDAAEGASCTRRFMPSEFVAWVVKRGGVKLPEGVGLEMVKVMVAGAGAEQASGGLDLPLEGSLNGVFSELGTLRVEEVVRVWVAREILVYMIYSDTYNRSKFGIYW